MPYTNPDSNAAHVRHGVKTGLAALLAYGLAGLIGLQYGYWAALSAVIVMQLSVADSLQMCWYRLSGTAVGAVIGMAAILAFPETRVWTAIALFLAVGFCAYMTRYNSRYRMAAITASIVLLASLGQEHRLYFGFERVVEIFIGVTCAFAVSVLLWPLREGRALLERLRIEFRECAELLTALAEAYLDRREPPARSRLDAFGADVMASRARLLKVLRHERLLYRDDTGSMSLMIDTLRLCLRNMGSLLHSLQDATDRGEPMLEPELRRVATLTACVMDAVGRGEIPDGGPLREALDRAEARIAELRGQGATRSLPTRELLQFFSFFHILRFMALDVLRHAKTPA